MKKLTTFLTLLLVAIMASNNMAQTSQTYTVDDIAQFQTDLTAGTYDEYILTTSGGIYDLTASNVNIGADAVIKAAEGLAEKPVIMRTGNTAADAGIFRTQNVPINLGLEGLIFDGIVTSETANQKVVGLRAESTVHVDVYNCVFRNFTNINGVFRLQGAESSMNLHNSVFHDITQRVIQPWQVDVTYGHFNIDNCLFYNINGAVVWYRSTGGGANLAIGTTLTVNHSTFHNIATNADGVFRGRSNNTGEVRILNSVFTDIAATRPVANAINNLTLDYCYVGSTPVVASGNEEPVVTNMFSTAPVYEDADNFVFRITNADDFLVPSGFVAGVVWYYPLEVDPDLLVEDNTTLKVVFDRPVDQATAEIADNYALSGTFGLTGNPSEAEIVNDYEVLLTVDDVSIVPLGQTIIVTVTGVEDTYGTALGENNVATYVGTDLLPTNEYPVEDIERFQTDLAAGTYDEYILTTSGGVYDLTSQVTITSSAVIKAAEGLAEKPVIQRSSNASTSQGLFRIQANTVNIGLEGLIFDGTFSAPGSTSPLGFLSQSQAHFSVNDCVFRNFLNSNGIFRIEGEMSTIDVRNSVFHDSNQRLIHYYEPGVTFGHVNIDNCLFYNITGSVVFTRTVSGNAAIGTTLTVNHSTFHNITPLASDGVFRGRNTATGETLIHNSVFTNINTPLSVQQPNVIVDYCYVGGLDPEPTGTNLFTEDPVYLDVDNFNFEIINAGDFIAATGDVAGVVWYYPPRVLPDLLAIGADKLRVVFSRPMNEASAETAASYTLSGTFGLTGNPSEVELVNDREVLVTVGDLTAMPFGETIVITVTGVEDIYGLAVADENNVATFTKSGFPVTFTVTFDDNGTSTPLEGAEILIDGIAGILTTNEDGEAFTILENGTYTYGVEFVDYIPAVDLTFEVVGEPVDVLVTLLPIPEPTLTMSPQVVTNQPGQTVTGSSNKTGFIVIVKNDAPQATVADIMTAIDANLAASADVATPGVEVTIFATGLQPGDYNGYAVDQNEVFSAVVENVVTVNDSPSNEYPVEEIDRLQADLAAGTFDEYILTTSGGIYDLTSYVSITSDVVIKAAEGLAEKPVLMRTSNTSGGAGIFRITAGPVNIVLEGLTFDGTVIGNNKVVAFRAEATTHFDVNNCVFRSFTEATGVLRLQGENSTVDVRNSTFHDNGDRMVHYWQVGITYGHVNIENCLFYNINGSIVYTRTTGGVPAVGSSVTINHSTFHNITPGSEAVIRGRNSATGETLILNSVFTDITGPLANQQPNVSVDYSYVGGFDPAPAGTNLFDEDPVYEDVDNFIFRITNEDGFIVESGDVAGVIWYYPPRVNPDLLVEDDNTLKLVFNRPLDQTTAETATNFTLSGTFGLTGNPSEAELVNDHEVLLTVNDISIVPLDQTIIVTVTGVEDTYGTVIVNNNVATYTGTATLETYTTLFQFSAVDANLPAWFGSATERGFASHGDHLVVASRNAGNFARILDRITGLPEGTLNTTGITGGFFGLAFNDIEISADGVVLACNVAGIGNYFTFKVYKLDATAEAELLIEYDITSATGRLGDKFTVVGSFADGSARLYAADASNPRVFLWTMVPDTKNGEFVFSAEPEIIPISVTAGNTPVVAPRPDGSFYYTASGRNVSLHNADGTLVGTISGELVAGSSTAIKFLGTEGEDYMLAVYQFGAGNENIRLVRVENGNPETAIIEFVTPTMFAVANGNGTGDIAFEPAPDGKNVDLYVLGTNNGLAGYRTQLLDIEFPVYPAPPAPVCEAPTGVQANEITHNSATIEWETEVPVKDALTWRYFLGTAPVGQPEVDGTLVLSPMVELSGLTPQTEYHFWVRSDCGGGVFSDWVGPLAFTTLAPVCDAPTNVAASDITHNSATIEWEGEVPYKDGVGWEYVYGTAPVAQPEGAGTSTQMPTVTLAELTPGTLYDFWVRTDCYDGFSDWVMVSFTTDFIMLGSSITFVVTEELGYNHYVPVEGADVEFHEEVKQTDAYGMATFHDVAHGIHLYEIFHVAYFPSSGAIMVEFPHMTVPVTLTVNNTDVTEISLADINVYPIPARTVLNVTSPESMKQLQIVNMLGQVVYTMEEAGLRYEINVTPFREGMYVVRIITDLGIETRTIQVIK